MLRVETDPQANAVYVYFGNKQAIYTKQLDEDRYIDYAEDSSPVGVDLLNVSEGVETQDLPHRSEIDQILTGLGIKLFGSGSI